MLSYCKQPVATSTPTPSTCSPEVQAAVAQLTRDLAASEEREHDLREQLKFAEEENRTIRRKLTDSEEEIESMNLQLRKLSGVPRRSSGSAGSGGTSRGSKDVEATELRLQMELAEQEVNVLRRKLGVVQGDNENLMTAVKYLRAKLEAGSTPDGLSRITGGSEELEACRAELSALRHRLTEVETAAEGGEKSKPNGSGCESASCSECERLRQQSTDVTQKLNDDSSKNEGLYNFLCFYLVFTIAERQLDIGLGLAFNRTSSRDRQIRAAAGGRLQPTRYRVS